MHDAEYGGAKTNGFRGPVHGPPQYVIFFVFCSEAPDAMYSDRSLMFLPLLGVSCLVCVGVTCVFFLFFFWFSVLSLWSSFSPHVALPTAVTCRARSGARKKSLHFAKLRPPKYVQAWISKPFIPTCVSFTLLLSVS